MTMTTLAAPSNLALINPSLFLARTIFTCNQVDNNNDDNDGDGGSNDVFGTIASKTG